MSVGGAETDPTWLSGRGALSAFRTGALSPVELTDALIARIEELEPRLCAFITPTFELAREQAMAIAGRGRNVAVV